LSYTEHMRSETEHTLSIRRVRVSVCWAYPEWDWAYAEHTPSETYHTLSIFFFNLCWAYMEWDLAYAEHMQSETERTLRICRGFINNSKTLLSMLCIRRVRLSVRWAYLCWAYAEWDWAYAEHTRSPQKHKYLSQFKSKKFFC